MRSSNTRPVAAPFQMRRLASVVIALIGAGVLPMITSAHAQSPQSPSLQGFQIISSTPMIGYVPISREVCRHEGVWVEGNRSGLGAGVGAVAGALVGGLFGAGAGKTGTILAGAGAGAYLGNQAERPGKGHAEMQYVCGPQVTQELRTVGYQVVYDNGSEQFQRRMLHDPLGGN